MFPKIAFLAGVLGALSAPAALGQTFTLDDTAPYVPLSYRVVDDFIAKDSGGNAAEITFNNSTGAGSNPYSVNPVGLKRTEVTLADGSSVAVFDLCAEIFVGPTGSSTYSVSDGFGSLSATQSENARILLSNAYDELILVSTSIGGTPPDYDATATVGAAIQLAFWEIIEDDLFGTGLYSLDDAGFFPGNLAISDFATDYTGTAADAISLAESFLQAINNGDWVDQDNLTYYYADSDGEQDRLWFTATPNAIPEPSTALLAFGGVLLVLRRRRQ